MDKSLQRYKLPKLTQEEMENLNSHILMKLIAFIIKSLCASSDGFFGEFYLAFKKEIIPILHKIFQNIEEETIPTDFMRKCLPIRPVLSKQLCNCQKVFKLFLTHTNTVIYGASDIRNFAYILYFCFYIPYF